MTEISQRFSWKFCFFVKWLWTIMEGQKCSMTRNYVQLGNISLDTVGKKRLSTGWCLTLTEKVSVCFVHTCFLLLLLIMAACLAACTMESWLTNLLASGTATIPWLHTHPHTLTHARMHTQSNWPLCAFISVCIVPLYVHRPCPLSLIVSLSHFVMWPLAGCITMVTL